MKSAQQVYAHLRATLSYDPETGVFTALKTIASRRAGEVVGFSGARSYLMTSVGCKLYLLHRLAWLYVHGCWPKFYIDHINGDCKDNRIANLRDVPQSVNMQNKRNVHTKSKSGLLGVTKHGRGWVARIRVDGKPKYIGRFQSPEDAHQAYLAVKRDVHPGCTI